jgi:hypothetical protein
MTVAMDSEEDGHELPVDTETPETILMRLLRQYSVEMNHLLVSLRDLCDRSGIRDSRVRYPW